MADNIDLIIRKITKLIEPILDEMDFDLVDVEYLAGRGKWILRIYIDKKGGITLDDCALVSREIGDLIDVKDIFQHKYDLEISSPGINRRLRREKHFLQAVGNKIKVKMLIPVNRRRNFTGYLRYVQDRTLYLEIGNGLIRLPLENIEKANLVYEFEN